MQIVKFFYSPHLPAKLFANPPLSLYLALMISKGKTVWGKWYLAVLLFLVAQIIFYYWFTHHWQ
jgi:hypothetical protein